MTRNLAARIERLEARHRIDATKVLGVIGYCDSQNWPAWDGKGPFIGVIGGVRFKPGEFTDRCLDQQRRLQIEIAAYDALLNEEAPQADAQVPGIVGTPAPLKPGQKARKFIHLPDGTEIQLKRT